MTDAFRCNGCSEYYDQEFRFVSVEKDTDVVQFADLTLDDIPAEVWSLLEDDGHGDFCPSCGLDLLAELVDLFKDGGSDD